MFSTFPDVEVLRLAKRIPQQYTQYLQSMFDKHSSTY